MNERKQSFLERLTGTQIIHDDVLEHEESTHENQEPWSQNVHEEEQEEDDNDEESDAGLPIDMYETENELIIQSMIAGVTSENLHISITRDTVTISGKRIQNEDIPDDSYIERELYWGTFSREITLPYEIDTDGADAIEKYGLLIIRLPRIDENRPQVLKVKSI